MKQPVKTTSSLACPSITSIGTDAQVFGVVIGSARDGLQVGYLTEALPATPELLEAAAPAKPTEIFRAAAPCSERPASISMAQIASSPHGLRRCSIR